MDIDLTGLVRPGLCLGGRYRLAEPVGAGGMAVVWRSWDAVLTRTVAVKLFTTHARDPRLAQIRREARIAAQLSHPNIAQVHDYGESVVAGELVPYVVMELVSGGTLLDRLRTGELPAHQALRICAEVAAALAAAHAAGLVHRDIKPANVMLAPTGAKVVDFGIAATKGPAASGDVVFGTPTYVAPERLTGAEILPASDVYALGVLLYRLLAGHAPWPADPPQRVLANHVYAEPPPLSPLDPVPAEVLDLCARCLRKSPDARPTAAEAAQVLAAAADLSDSTEMAGDGRGESSTVVDPPARNGSRTALRLLAAGIVVAIATTAAWLAARDDPAVPVIPPAEAAAPPSAAAASTPPSRPAATPVEVAPARPGRPGPTTAGAAPAATTPGAILPPPPGATTAPATPGPTATPTTSPPAPPTTVPVERTMSSPAGTVTADCPTADTARILSWTVARSYTMHEVDTTPGPAPTATFRHGKETVTMTVTCEAGVPRSQIS